ncbi:transcriptional regulator family: Fungal Specific TF [Penicillium canescens]|uniref:Transcriptional regulator family: Fungal Specific TF n=1 Tax=Penicillium canescens TaxID=5083 RepID=A0AAD6I958_PENCN|nr:transcriptional regulator family: Fungal Specific TF [Penicillium canescens]KAJ6038227.1 transcriptional regulator family: Fungal Specific TF [Penicillium canescens]KAJ6039648.1 transcriptional regulator family: Fungal Specific TF [Penicillium canescens]KAJ6068003.1 transcriptional regulator family: Fungal Specific TF [Penicillium canescens]
MHTKTRLRKACDACSIRKVKCDISGPPCRSCVLVGIQCTSMRPSRRRGPSNRHAESLKKQKLQAQSDKSPLSLSAHPLPSTPQSCAAFTHLPTTTIPASAEAICSLHTVQLLLDDFFFYIHPLVPVPHEPTFRAAFERRDDTTSGTFLALLASMIGFLVASFPRRPKLRLNTKTERSAFPNSIALVKHCHNVAIQARGIGYLERNVTVYDAATSYFLGACSGYVQNLHRCHVYLAECLAMIQVYDLCHSPTALPSTPGRNATTSISLKSGIKFDWPARNITDNSEIDLITQELGRRLFYVTLVEYQHLHQMGSSTTKVHIPTEIDRYPPLPLEIDDEFLFSTNVGAQPAERVSRLVAFNANVRVYGSNNALLAWEVAFGSGQTFDWEHQRLGLWECLQKAKSALSNVPAELSLFHPKGNSAAEFSGLNEDGSIFDYPNEHSHQERRAIQYQIQKANIYVSQLCTRSYLVEKYWDLFDTFTRYGKLAKTSTPALATSHMNAGPSSEAPVEPSSLASPIISSQALTHVHTDAIGHAMAEERKLVIRELYILLRTVKQENMEPNGGSITTKIRQVASTLLNQSTTSIPTEHPFAIPRAGFFDPGPNTSKLLVLTADEARFYLHSFIDTLIRLDGHASAATDPGSGNEA